MYKNVNPSNHNIQNIIITVVIYTPHFQQHFKYRHFNFCILGLKYVFMIFLQHRQLARGEIRHPTRFSGEHQSPGHTLTRVYRYTKW